MKKPSVDPVGEKLPEVIGIQQTKQTNRRQGPMLEKQDADSVGAARCIHRGKPSHTFFLVSLR